jgi:hypothetical protein
MFGTGKIKACGFPTTVTVRVTRSARASEGFQYRQNEHPCMSEHTLDGNLFVEETGIPGICHIKVTLVLDEPFCGLVH